MINITFLSSSPIRLILQLTAILILTNTSITAQAQQPDTLRVCADPNNLPFSNKKQQGFENKIAEVIANDLSLELEYVWFPQRMGFIRNTLKKWLDDKQRFACDLVIGVPRQFDISDTTVPYYRSSYTMLFKRTGLLANIYNQQDLAQLTINEKNKLRIAAFSPSPAVDWLQRYQLFERTEFFRMMNGDPNDYPGKLVQQLTTNKFDIVFIWGPISGYFSQQANEKSLVVMALTSEENIKFDYEISMGLRRHDRLWKIRIEDSIKVNKRKIDEILRKYGVPLIN
ncbi:MAG: quinoprotein dehydrogenase-associated putative ABC transporter substrate-binding protein [Gammaproteobacteria bacterium]|nr:quinoprotein dehydrogenase-associated putative ABC transporter substrate-binding protein [Gammaproteobacteria bacterium]